MKKKYELIKPCTLLFFLIIFSTPVGAIDFSLTEIREPSRLLGMTVSGVFEMMGPPASIFPLRGVEEWQDDVVCFYNSGIYLYFYQDRVWQVRIDENSAFSWRGIQRGLDSEEIARLLGLRPIHREADWEIYFLSESPFPLRLRIFYKEDRASDFYLYRGDF